MCAFKAKLRARREAGNSPRMDARSPPPCRSAAKRKAPCGFKQKIPASYAGKRRNGIFVFGENWGNVILSVHSDNLRGRKMSQKNTRYGGKQSVFCRILCWWEEVDSNHRSRRRQIYSLIHLAALESSRIKLFRWSRWQESNL